MAYGMVWWLQMKLRKILNDILKLDGIMSRLQLGRNCHIAMRTESNVCNDQEMQKVCHICNSSDRELVKWHGLDFTQYVYFENKVKYQWQLKKITEKDDTKCLIGDYLFLQTWRLSFANVTKDIGRNHLLV